MISCSQISGSFFGTTLCNLSIASSINSISTTPTCKFFLMTVQFRLPKAKEKVRQYLKTFYLTTRVLQIPTCSLYGSLVKCCQSVLLRTNPFFMAVKEPSYIAILLFLPLRGVVFYNLVLMLILQFSISF